ASKGALVARVFAGSPAQSAGLRTGDVITSIGGRPVDSRESFATYSATLASGQPVEIVFMRGGSSERVQVRPGEPPTNLGVRILEETAGLHVVDQSSSVVIDRVDRGSRAERIGISAGDVIVGVNGVQTRSAKQLNDELIRSADRSSYVLNVLHGGVIYGLTFPMAV
ncbi:MAG: PDZ domain-containing protein, partial [Thermoanaerobaculia bacterium]